MLAATYVTLGLELIDEDDNIRVGELNWTARMNQLLTNPHAVRARGVPHQPRPMAF
jgi:hypothetical protein